jgi:hypothetical protein
MIARLKRYYLCTSDGFGNGSAYGYTYGFDYGDGGGYAVGYGFGYGSCDGTDCGYGDGNYNYAGSHCRLKQKERSVS